MGSTTRSLSLLTTQSLLGHAKAGSNSAWKILLLRYRMTLRVAASRHLRNREDAEDVVQSAFMDAVSSLEKFEYRDEGSFRNYLVRTVVNSSIDLLRTRRPFHTVDFTGIVDPSSVSDDQFDGEHVVVAISKLSDSLREIVLMKKYESKTWEEIAELTQQSQSSVSRKFAKAIRVLKSHLS